MPQIIRGLFEEEFKKKFDFEEAIAVNSCTSALIATLWSLDLQPEDEVITTPFTFAATTEAILIAGGIPVFVDIHPETHLIDPSKIPRALTDRTKAILPVHLFGRVCDMTHICEISEKFNIPIIEDAAQALGCEHDGTPVGAIGDAGCFSFYKTKNLSTFEGGMIGIKKNSKLDAQRIREIANPTDNKREFAELGFNFRMPEPCALIGYEQLKLHERGWRAELGKYNENHGFYPYVTYELPFCQKRGIVGNCPIAKALAKNIKELFVQRD